MSQEEPNPPVGGPFWQLVHPGAGNFTYRLPEAMIFVGREECDVTVQARSVDKRHAVIMYDYCDKRFKVKDLNSANGTFVNEVRIPVQTYIQLDSMDLLRFGFDSTAYQVVRVPGPGEEMPATASDANNPSVILHEQQNGFQEHSSRSSSPREPISATTGREGRAASEEPPRTAVSRNLSAPPALVAATSTSSLHSAFSEDSLLGDATKSATIETSTNQVQQPTVATTTPTTPPATVVEPIPFVEQVACASPVVAVTPTLPSLAAVTTLSPVTELPPSPLPVTSPSQEQTVHTPSPCDSATSSSGSGITGGEGTSSSPSSSSSAPPPPAPQLHPMAFTVDLTDLGGSKRLDIGDSISKFVPRHRRNLSVSRQEEAKQRQEKLQQENTEQQQRAKTPLSPPSRNTAVVQQQQAAPPQAAPAVAQLQMRRAGYHSEGYFSSDQEEDLSTKSDLSVRKAKALDKGPGRTTNLAQEKRTKPDLPPLSPVVARATPAVDRRTASLEESVSEPFPHVLGEVSSPVRRQASCGTPNQKQLTQHKQQSPEQAEAIDVEDNVSEAGTYTIDKESPSPEEKRARNEIDVVFGVDAPVSPTCDTRTFTRPKPDMNGLPHQEGPIKSASYRGGPNWIKEWAAQVAEQQQQQQREEVVLPSLTRGRVPSPSRGVPTSPLLSPGMGWPPPPAEPPPVQRLPRHKLSSASPVLSDHSDLTDSPGRRRPLQLQDTETESYLRTTESVVTAMQARVTAAEEGPTADELSAQLRARLRALEHKGVVSQPSPSPQPAAGPARRLAAVRTQQRASGEGQSDSSSEAGDKPRSRADSAGPHTRYNRAFSLRRARVEAEEAEKNRAKPTPAPSSAPTRGGPPRVPQSVTRPRKLEPARPTNSSPSTASKPPVHSASTGNFSRADGGRFSLRAGKVANQAPVIPKTRPTTHAAPTRTPASAGSKKNSARSNSSLNAREVEFQNWKRRKSYDPMKAAAEGKKKAEAARKTGGHTQQPCPNVMTQSAIVPATSASPKSSPLNSILRSASFHGTGGMARPARHQHGSAATSEDEATLSAEEEEEDEILVVQQYSPVNASPRHARPSPLPPPLRCTSQPPDPGHPRKSSVDETMDGGNSRGFTRNTTPTSSVRSRGKLEALDNLVIAAIHGFSNKIKGSSHNVLSKLRVLFQEDPEKASMLEETLALLEEGEPPTSSPSKSPSKELSGTLRNLKKLEHVFSVLDEVLFGDEDLEDEEVEEEEELSDLEADQLQAN